MAISKDAVFAAAESILASGARVTLEGVRQVTGGSYTTISPALNEWKAKQAAAVPLREAAPQAVLDRLADLGSEVWAAALELANSRLAVERQALEKARYELEADRDEAIALADQLSAELDAVQGLLLKAQESAAAAQGQVQELDGALGAELVRTQTTEARLEELRRELDRSQGGVLEATKEAFAARELAARLEGQLEAVKEQNQMLLARLPGVRE